MYRPLLLIATTMLILACSRESFSEYERTSVGFQVTIGGEIDPTHLWRAAADVHVTVKSPDSTTVRAYITQGERLYLADMKTAAPNGTVTLAVPQGFDNTVKLTANTNQKSATQSLELTGALEYHTTIDLESGNAYNSTARHQAYAPMMAQDNGAHRASIKPEFNGHSLLGNGYYTEWDVQDWLDIALLAGRCIDPSTLEGEIVDYELTSNGPFQISFICGYKGYSDSHILGYYYHSPGTYEDVTFVDIADTHKYFYLDGKCMVQYQLDSIDVWYDANYNLDYKIDSEKAITNNIVNSLKVAEEYYDRITKTRGLTFPINVPKGMKVGFYLREEKTASPEQYEQLISLGFPQDRIKKPFKATNFSAKVLNIDKTHRSWIKSCHHYTFMGMEDIIGGGDFDCNDVMFGFTALDADADLPDIVESEVNYIRPADPLPWTIAYEDVGRDTDFDFNDGVISIVPDYENEQMCVYVLAAGYNNKIYLHYDGPDGDQNLGELHEILGTATDVTVNTTTGTAKPGVAIDCVKWPKDFTIENDAQRFYVEVFRGTCDDCSDMITLSDVPGQLPQALLIPGGWSWPREGVHIYNAYNQFGLWAQDNVNLRNWPWHTTPTQGATVSR